MTNTCTWIGSGERCTHHAMEGRSYCLHHYPQVYQAGTARARRKKDERVAQQVWSVVDSFNEAVAELEAEGYDFGEERWEARGLDLD